MVPLEVPEAAAHLVPAAAVAAMEALAKMGVVPLEAVEAVALRLVLKEETAILLVSPE